MTFRSKLTFGNLKEDARRAASILIKSLPPSVCPNHGEHFHRTIERFADFWAEINKYCVDEYRESELEKCAVTQPTDNSEMIVCEPIDFYSLCPHHLLPVIGRAYVGYVPNGKCFGLSKMPRIVRLLASRPIIQEDLTEEIRKTMEKFLFEEPPKQDDDWGVMVVLKAKHMCMLLRGVKVNSDCVVTTSSISGCFRGERKGARQEFLSLIRH